MAFHVLGPINDATNPAQCTSAYSRRGWTVSPGQKALTFSSSGNDSAARKGRALFYRRVNPLTPTESAQQTGSRLALPLARVNV